MSAGLSMRLDIAKERTLSQTDDRQGLPLDFDTHQTTPLPLLSFQSGATLGDVPRSRHHQCDCVFRGGSDVSGR